MDHDFSFVRGTIVTVAMWIGIGAAIFESWPAVVGAFLVILLVTLEW